MPSLTRFQTLRWVPAIAALALVSFIVVPARAAETAAACTGTFDASAPVTHCGKFTVSGVGGETFDLVLDRDTQVSLAACGLNPRDSFYCKLSSTGSSPMRGLLLHEPISATNAENFRYLWMGEHTVEASGGFREIGFARGFQEVTIPTGEPGTGYRGVIIPAGTYRVSLLANGTPTSVSLSTSGTAASLDEEVAGVTVVPPAGPSNWRNLALEYGNATVGGMGADFDTKGPSFAVMNFSWTSPTYVSEAAFGVCAYENPTTMPQVAYAPGCPDRFVGGNDAFEFQYPLLFGGPTGQRITLHKAGGADRFAFGGWHAGVMVGGQTQGFALDIPLR